MTIYQQQHHHNLGGLVPTDIRGEEKRSMFFFKDNRENNQRYTCYWIKEMFTISKQLQPQIYTKFRKFPIEQTGEPETCCFLQSLDVQQQNISHSKQNKYKKKRFQ